MQFSDGVECQEPAKANIGDIWYCAEHYDWWIGYYERVKHGDYHNTDEARKILKTL